MATPEARPFRSEKVITLDISGASEGSRKPLRPSRRPSVPPSIRPSIGLVTLMFPSRKARCGPRLLCVRIALHQSEQVSFRVLAVREIADGGNRSFRHDLFAAGAGDCSDSFLDRL